MGQVVADPCEQTGQRIAARERDPDLARRDLDACSDLEELEADLSGDEDLRADRRR